MAPRSVPRPSQAGTCSGRSTGRRTRRGMRCWWPDRSAFYCPSIAPRRLPRVQYRLWLHQGIKNRDKTANSFQVFWLLPARCRIARPVSLTCPDIHPQPYCVTKTCQPCPLFPIYLLLYKRTWLVRAAVPVPSMHSRPRSSLTHTQPHYSRLLSTRAAQSTSHAHRTCFDPTVCLRCRQRGENKLSSVQENKHVTEKSGG